MAHSLQKRAQVYALLLAGNSTRYTARETGIPLATVKRWRSDCFRDYGYIMRDLRDMLRQSPEGRELIEIGRRFRQSNKMSLKKSIERSA